MELSMSDLLLILVGVQVVQVFVLGMLLGRLL